MNRKSDDWMDLYRKEPEVEEEFIIPEGPVLFYNELVAEHSTNPRNVGEITAADGCAQVGDPACGDQMKLWIKVEDGKIADIKFTSTGCAGAIAASSMCTELAMGKTLEEAQQMTDDDVIIALEGIPEQSKNCSLSGVAALHAAIKDYESRCGSDN
ncbi:MAG: iron-sulfur cluster assembly scaffold protein [Proteobacteria bacterium]|nr:iron-sulfur cluster assembly scaffold protein [Pseudomonadota bacterium]